MTELSFDFDVDGRNILAPLLVPTLTAQEVKYLQDGGEPTDEIYRKAQDFAIGRAKEGKSPFYGEGDEQVVRMDAPAPTDRFGVELPKNLSREALKQALPGFEEREAEAKKKEAEYADAWGGLSLPEVQAIRQNDIPQQVQALRGMEQGYMANQEQLEFAKTDLDGLAQQLREQVAANPSFGPQAEAQYAQAVEQYNQMVGGLNEKWKAIQDQQTYIQKQEQQALRRETELKSQQGGPIGAAWNSVMSGVGRMTSGVTDYLIDAMVELGVGVPEGTDTPEQKDALKKEVKAMMLPDIRRGAKEVLGTKSTTDEYVNRVKEEHPIVGGGLLGLAESAPAMVSPYMAGIFFQVSDAVGEEMSAPEFDGVSENEKLLMKGLLGSAGMALERFGFRNLVGNTGVTKGIVLRALEKAPKNSTGRQIANLINAETPSVALNFTSRMFGAGAAEAETGGLQNLSDIALKSIYDEAKGKDMFKNPKSAKEIISSTIEASLQEAIGGKVMGLPSALSKAVRDRSLKNVLGDTKEYDMVEKLLRDQAFAEAVPEEHKRLVDAGEITQAQADAANADWEASRAVVEKIPEDLSPEQRKEAFLLLTDKARLSTMEKALVGDRIAAIDEQLKALVQKTDEQGGTTASTNVEQHPAGVGVGASTTEDGSTTEQVGERPIEQPGSVEAVPDGQRADERPAVPGVQGEAAPATPTDTDAEGGLQVEGREVTEEHRNEQERIADDALLGGKAQEHRAAGKRVIAGQEYKRQAPQDAPEGNSGRIQFSEGVDADFDYVLMEADAVQPSHTDGRRNPTHFIPEAQPKGRTDKESQAASGRIAAAPDMGKVGASPNAYSGAPVVNARGEVVQGNNRASGLKQHYKQGGKAYKEALAQRAAEFGLTPQQVQGMKNPVLVRRVSVPDAKAIELGNYDAKDIETGGKRGIDPVAVSARIPSAVKGRIAEALFKDGDTTLKAAIRDRFGDVVRLLEPYLNPAQRASLYKTGTNEPSARGMQEMEGLVKHFLFDGGPVELAEIFESLPHHAQQGIVAAMPAIFSSPQAVPIAAEVQRGILAAGQFRASGVESFDAWANQADAFGPSPAQEFSPVELAVAKLLAEAKTTKAVREKLAQYAGLTSPTEATMFDEASEGLSKEQAAEQVFGVKPRNDGNDTRTDTKGDAQVRQTTGRGARTSDAGAGGLDAEGGGPVGREVSGEAVSEDTGGGETAAAGASAVSGGGQVAPPSSAELDAGVDALNDWTEHLKEQPSKPSDEAAQDGPVQQAGATTRMGLDNKPLDDFGEKLEGARKDLPPGLKEEVSDERIAELPLSKVWPANAHENVGDPVAAALAFSARAEVPPKPRLGYKVRRWAATVRGLRDLVRNMNGSLEAMERMASEKNNETLVPFFIKVRLLSQLPRETWGRVERVGVFPNARRLKTDEELRTEGIVMEKGAAQLPRYYRIDPTTGERTNISTHFGPDSHTLYAPNPHAIVTIDGRSHVLKGATSMGPDEVRQVKDLLGNKTPKQDGMRASDFDIRQRRKDGVVFINRKGDNEYRPLKEFHGKDAVNEARAWMKQDGNLKHLESEWDKVKARDNVTKADVRRDENRERKGENRRGGKDVTERMFTDAFGFRGVQFGNWVGQGKGGKERQGLLNEVYDALMDLSDILGIPSQAISLNGTLGLGLGSRGSGKASAHFEPDTLVINLTKTRGAGSLAHEWFHALDNYFSRKRGGERKASDQDAYRRGNYITYRPEAPWVHKVSDRVVPRTSAQLRDELKRRGEWDDTKTLAENADAAGYKRSPQHPEGVRPEVEQAFADLVEALNRTPMAKRASTMDKGRDGYWSRIIERGARSFENYVISKMAQRGWGNDFLANVRDFQEWAERGKNAERYPYLLPEEEAPVVDAFDNLFGTIETERTDTGTALFQLPHDGQKKQEYTGKPRIDRIIKALAEIAPGLSITIAKTQEEFAALVKDIGGDGVASAWGVFYRDANGRPRIVVNPNAPNVANTLFHEAAHPIIAALAHSRPDLFQKFYNEAIKADGGKYERFGNLYKDKSTQVQQEEAMVQYVADILSAIARKEIPVSTRKDSLYQQVKAFIQDILAALGWDTRSIDLSNPDSLREMAGQIAKALEKGIKITGLQPSTSPMAMFAKEMGITVEEAQRQYGAVVAQYTNKDGTKKEGWMKAPNGQATNLNELQWVQTRTPAFLNWFGDFLNDPENASKVVDANGDPMVVYHGTRGDFDRFDPGRASDKAKYGRGFYFAVDHDVAGGIGKYTDPATATAEEIGYAASFNVAGHAWQALEWVLDRPLTDADARKVLQRLNTRAALRDADSDIGIRNTWNALRRAAEEGPAALQRVLERNGNAWGVLDKIGVARQLASRPNVMAVFLNIREPASGSLDASGRNDGAFVNERGGIWVATRPNQIKSATANTGQFGPTGNIMMKADADRLVNGWYSRLRDAVNSKGRTQPASEWKNWIAARAKEGSFSLEEAKWTGLNDWLDSKGKEKVTPEEVRKFLDENRVKVEVKIFGGDLATETGSDWTGGGDMYRSSTGYWIQKADDGRWKVYDENGLIRYVPSLETAKSFADESARVDALPTPPKFSQAKYQLPGASNYREVLVTLPSAEGSSLTESTGDAAMRVLGKPWSDLTDEERTTVLDNMRERAKSATPDKVFRSSHFDEPNILVHLRLNDRTDADGRRVLFIEEIQSDWGASRRKLQESIDKNFDAIVEKMKADGVLKKRCP